MYKKSPQGWLKHWDFILLDIFCLQLAFVVAYLVRQGLENPYSDQIYRTVAFVFMLCQIVVMFLGQSYQDILKRGYYIEFTKTAKHVLMVMLLSVLYLFATQQAVSYSRLTLFYTAFLYLCFDYVGRVWHKENVLKKNATKKKEKSMVVVVSLAEAKETIEKILSAPIQNFSINGIALIDDNPGVKEIAGIPVVGNMDTISEYLCHEWVDEVFVKISETEPYPQKLIDEIIIMGLTVHLSLGEMEKSSQRKEFYRKNRWIFGNYIQHQYRITETAALQEADGYCRRNCRLPAYRNPDRCHRTDDLHQIPGADLLLTGAYR